MSEEIQEVAETTAPEQEAPAAPAPEEPAPETQETEEQPRTFTQEELDAAIGKRLAKERRKWEREAVNPAQLSPKPAPNTPLTPDQFETYEQYAEALAEVKAHDLIRQHEAQRQRHEIESTYAEREEDARTKYDDFEQVAYNPNLRITAEMAETIKDSEIGPDIAYWLGTNPKEASRISQLSPLRQAREIGKIEAKLGSEPVVKKASSAPAPIKPVTARNSSNPSYDTTDPRSIKTMSTSEWIEKERERQIRKLQSQR
jgi:hypothetical protein